MPLMFRVMFALLPFLWLSDGGEDASGDTDDDAAEDRDDTGEDESLGDKGREAIRKEREARKAADKRAADLEKRLADIEAEARRRAADEAAEQGRFKELAEQREADLTKATESLIAITAERDALLELVKADVDAAWKATPDEVKELYAGADDDVLAKKQHLARSAKLIARLTDASTTKPGNGPNPNPADGNRDRTAELARARATGKYTI